MHIMFVANCVIIVLHMRVPLQEMLQSRDVEIAQLKGNQVLVGMQLQSVGHPEEFP